MRNFTGIMSTRRGRMIPKIESRERPSPRNLRTKTPSVNELRKKFSKSKILWKICIMDLVKMTMTE